MSPMLDVQKRHAEVYRLRLGEKGSNGAPVKLTDAIRVTSPSRTVIDAFVDVFGGETSAWNNDGPQWQAKLPTTELPIFILPGQSITQWWEMYRGSVCERRCDSEFESLSGGPCLCPHAGDPVARAADRNACSPMTRINVICPDVEVVGAGGLVSHGLIAAETLPQSIMIAQAALSRGLMVPAILRVVEHKGKRHYVVPQVEIVGVTPRALVTGEVTDALEIGNGKAQPALTAGGEEEQRRPARPASVPHPPTSEAKASRPPKPDLEAPDPVPPAPSAGQGSGFDPANFAANFAKGLAENKIDEEVGAAIVAFATGGRTRDPATVTGPESIQVGICAKAFLNDGFKVHFDADGVCSLEEEKF